MWPRVIGPETRFAITRPGSATTRQGSAPPRASSSRQKLARRSGPEAWMARASRAHTRSEPGVSDPAGASCLERCGSGARRPHRRNKGRRPRARPGLTIAGECTSHARVEVIPQKKPDRLTVDPRAGVKTCIFPAWAAKARRFESLARPQSHNETPLIGGTFARGILRRAPHCATARGLEMGNRHVARSHRYDARRRPESRFRGPRSALSSSACIYLGVDRESAFAGVCRPLPVRSRSAAPCRGGTVCH